MRDLLDRLGCFLQIALGVGLWLLLVGRTPLPGWAEALLAVGGSYVGMFVLMAVVGKVLDTVE